ncbi:hypothetical protein J2R76_000059 [Bradyrhizobium sp. USDA 4532]|nr:hypothetical protein [Bradyrhizobium sp. USDA 4545]MCP1916468.1 hypothetical protein [Bradyrhizobium sp. USDA 4532]
MSPKTAARSSKLTGGGTSLSVALGERGPVWWDDGADFNSYAVKNTPYAGWYSKQRSV